MGGLTRSLKYATFRAGRVIGMTLLMAVGFVFYFAFLDGSKFTMENLVLRFPMMLLFMGNLMIMLYGMIDVVTYTQLTLTYGCTRKNAAISTVYMHLLQILAFEVIMVISCVLIPADWNAPDGKKICSLALVLFLFGSGLALVAGMLIHRFGKVAYIIVVIVCSSGGGLVGALVGFKGSSMFLMEFFMKLLDITVLNVVGIIWYVVAAVIFWLCIRKIEVRV